jgi:hypothetical protein
MKDKLFFGAWLPAAIAAVNFLVTGTVGSGKTILQRLLLQFFLPRIKPGSDRRAVVFDPMREMLQLLSGMGLDCPVVIMDPFDERCQPWDVAADITTPAAAMQLAAAFVPPENHTNRFFSDAARAILRAVIVALNWLAHGKWTLRDLVLVVTNVTLLKHVLSLCPATQHVLDNYAEERVFLNVMATIQSRIDRFEPIAALWHTARLAPASLKEFLNRNEILLLRNDPAIYEAQQTLNQLLLKRLQEILLSQPGSRTRETIIALDELPALGKLEGLTELLLMGRSKGVRHILGFQDIDSLRRLYGKEGANEIIGQCGNKAILRLDSPETARWASDVLGKYLGPEVTRNWDREGQVSHAEHRVERDAMLPSEFMSFPPTGPGTGLTGLFLSPSIGAWKGTIRWDFLMNNLLPPGPVPDFLPRPDDEQILKPFTPEDLKRLGLGYVPAPQGPRLKFTAKP